MERLSILVDGAVVQPSDLPRKILDQVGDASALPEVEEQSAPEAAVPSPRPRTAARRAVSCGGRARPAPSGNLSGRICVLETWGWNLKDFLTLRKAA